MRADRTRILISFLLLITVFSCKKEETNVPVSSDCVLPFADSSESNPRGSAYQSILDKYVKRGLPGLIVLIRTPAEGIWVGASGDARIENHTLMKPCDIVYSASIGKTYCAVAIMQLVDEGKISLDDKINQYLPSDICDNIPNANDATIRQVLGHTAGIPNFDDDPQFIADVLNNPFAITTDGMIKYVYGEKALNAPGDEYHYSSTGYELLARIIDNVTGENHSKFYTSHIFQPLGLTSTYYKNEPGFPEPDGLVNCYFERLNDGKIENVSDINNYLTQMFTGSDGIMASVYDYSVFIDALVTGKLVSPGSYNQMTQWHDAPAGTTKKYGLGLQRRETPYGYKIGHDGDAMGAGTDMYYFPESGITIVTATNVGTFLETDLPKVYDEFQDEMLDTVFRKNL
jgi:D-alanyl-D-alanine carboxypeptidase